MKKMNIAFHLRNDDSKSHYQAIHKTLIINYYEENELGFRDCQVITKFTHISDYNQKIIY